MTKSSLSELVLYDLRISFAKNYNYEMTNSIIIVNSLFVLSWDAYIKRKDGRHLYFITSQNYTSITKNSEHKDFL
jgi:hypothetical protein